MLSFRQRIIESAEYIKSRINTLPEIGLITGTGLSDSLTDLEISQTFDYSNLPHFPQTTVASHKGCLAFGTLNGKNLLIFQGRFHLYEGYSPQDVTFPVRLLQALEVPVLILSNAAGGLNLNFTAGDIMLIDDHINLTGKNPLVGPEDESWGLRFPDMTRVYDNRLRELSMAAAQDEKLVLRRGVYAGLLGPSLETPSETRFLKTIGADAVGFSTIMEAIAGVQAGMKILGLSLISNINDPDAPQETTLEGVVEIAAKASKKMNQLISRLAGQID